MTARSRRRRVLALTALGLWLLAHATGRSCPLAFTDSAIYGEGNVQVQETVAGSIARHAGSTAVKPAADIDGEVAAGEDVRIGSGARIDGAVAAAGTIVTARTAHR